MMATNTAGDIRENIIHQSLFSPEELLEVVLLQSVQVCIISTEVNVTPTSRNYLNNIIHPVTAPLHATQV